MAKHDGAKSRAPGNSPGQTAKPYSAHEQNTQSAASCQALALLELGLRPIPCDVQTKRPLVEWKRFQTEAPMVEDVVEMFAAHPAACVAILTGHAGGLSAIDLDLSDTGKLNTAWIPDGCELPTGCVLSTPRGGRHHLFQHVAGLRNSAGKIAPHVDVRGEGGYLVVCGPGREILHGSFSEAHDTECPPWLSALLLAPTKDAPRDRDAVRDRKRHLLDGAEEGERHDRLYRYACSLRAKNIHEREAIILITAAMAACSPPYTEETAASLVSDVWARHAAVDADHLDRLTPIDAIAAETVRWLWPAYIPRGKLTLLAGDPGGGKTFLLCDLIARLTKGGQWPDGTAGGSPENVLFLTYEDGLADTIRPRLEAAHADLTRVHVVPGPPTIEHLEAVHAMLDEVRPALLAIDPINGFIGLDANKAHEVRPALQQLAALADAHGAAVLATHHLNKAGAGSGLSPLYRLLGSVEFGAVARSIIGVTRDRDGDRRLFSPIKSSLAPEASAYDFELVASKIKWIGPTTDTAEDAMNPEEGSALREATLFLAATLADGPVLSSDVIKEATRQGIAERTLKRAKARMGIEAHRSDGSWHWRNP